MQPWQIINRTVCLYTLIRQLTVKFQLLNFAVPAGIAEQDTGLILMCYPAIPGNRIPALPDAVATGWYHPESATRNALSKENTRLEITLLQQKNYKPRQPIRKKSV
ncbi:MAG: hypothetical protein DWB48_02115 [Nitrosomonas sp.]|nr:hypothetical protein [Nitrosomonas sp.]